MRLISRIRAGAAIVAVLSLAASPAYATSSWTLSPLAMSRGTGLAAPDEVTTEYFGWKWERVGLDTFGSPVWLHTVSVPVAGGASQSAFPGNHALADGCAVPASGYGAVLIQYAENIGLPAAVDDRILSVTAPQRFFPYPTFVGGTQVKHYTPDLFTEDWVSSAQVGNGGTYPTITDGAPGVAAAFEEGAWRCNATGRAIVAFRPAGGGLTEFVFRADERVEVPGARSVDPVYEVIGQTYREATGTVNAMELVTLEVDCFGTTGQRYWTGSAWYTPSTVVAMTPQSIGLGYSAVTTDTATVDAIFEAFAVDDFGEYTSVTATTTPIAEGVLGETTLGDLDDFELPDGSPSWLQKLVGEWSDSLQAIADSLGSLFWPFELLGGEF